MAWAGKDASKFFNEIHKGVKSHGFWTARDDTLPIVENRPGIFRL